jgi:acetyl esterase/lipase
MPTLTLARILRVSCAACLATLCWSPRFARADNPPAAAASPDVPKVVRLWEGDAPGAQGKEDKDIPTLTVYSPPANKNNGAAVVVCPGGGYGGLAPHEGSPVADWLNQHGATGLVLKYRLGPRYHHPVMLNDVNRAIRMARAHADEWHIDPSRVGVLGFSAGGHLASTAATHWDRGDPNAADPVDRQSSRPDVAVLVYPVVTMKPPFTHGGSRNNLLGASPDEKLVDLTSNELQVTKETPPTYLVHSSDDKVVPIENSLQFATALSKNGVPFGMRVFDHGGHGFGMGTNDPELGTWPESCYQWLDHRGFFKPSAGEKGKAEKKEGK